MPQNQEQRKNKNEHTNNYAKRKQKAAWCNVTTTPKRSVKSSRRASKRIRGYTSKKKQEE
jgi:hypothetical protein